MQRENSQPTPLEKRRTWEIVRRLDQVVIAAIEANTVTDAWKTYESRFTTPRMRSLYDVRRVIDAPRKGPAGLQRRFAP